MERPERIAPAEKESSRIMRMDCQSGTIDTPSSPIIPFAKDRMVKMFFSLIDRPMEERGSSLL